MDPGQQLKPGEALDRFGTDLTAKAEKGSLDPVIGIFELILRKRL
jgi:ATP-dependent Clp protease ATP-binding subunit ClpA